MKCRCRFDDSASVVQPTDGRRGPVRDPFDVEFTESAQAAAPARSGPVAEPEPGPEAFLPPVTDPPASEKPNIGAGGHVEPPDWARKQDSARTSATIDDMFAADSRFDPGGYKVDDPVNRPDAHGAPPGDAYSVMNSNTVRSGSDDKPGRKRGKGKEKKLAPRKQDPLQQAIDGMPSAAPNSPFGLLCDDEEDIPDRYEPPTGKKKRPRKPRGGKSTAGARGGRGRQDAYPPPQGVRPGAFTPPSYGAPPGGQHSGAGMQAPGPAMPTGKRQPAGRAPEDTPTSHSGPVTISSHQTGMMAGPGMAGDLPQPLGGGVPAGPARIRRPVPGAGRVVAGQGRAKAPRASSRARGPALARVKDLATPRMMLAVITGVITLFAAVYLLFGGGYFASPAQKELDAAAGTMAAQQSVHIQAEILTQSEKMGTQTASAIIDISKNTDQHSVYPAATFRPATEYVTATARTFKRTDNGAWQISTGSLNPDFTTASMFKGASGARLIGQEPIDGVMCDRIAFDSGSPFVSSLIPSGETMGGTMVTTEVWIDPGQKTVKHVRIDATELETYKLGKFNCHVEASVGVSPNAIPIGPPM